MLSVDDNGLFEIFPMVETISNSFEYQNSTLNKIVLTGKINALEIAENLFNFTEQTAQTFAELQTKLIEHLLEENKKELLLKAKSKANIILNLLATSFENRKRDVELFSQDKTLKDFLELKIDKNSFMKRLETFANQHQIFNEVLILDPKGKVKAHINEENRVRYSKDDILKSILEEDEVVEVYKKTDMFIKQKESYFFAKRVVRGEKVLGIVVLFYDLNAEAKLIFEHLINEKETIIVVDKSNNILFASEKGIDKNFVKRVNKVNDYVIFNHRFYYKAKIDKLDLYAIVSYPKSADINIVSEFDDRNTNNRELIDIGVNNKALKKLADDGYEILEDLSDVIINGELIAAKSKQYILIPILDNLREVSFRVVKLIELSISNLQKIINKSITNHTHLFAKALGDIISRYIYERCLDIKSFAMDEDIFDSSKLQYLNNLYPMYSDIFVYDTDSKITAISNSKHFVGDVIEHNYTNTNKDPNRCFVTPFIPTKFYDNRPTYICFASIIRDGKVVGGVGAVLDINREFFEILNSTFDEHIIAIITNSHKKIISSNTDEFSILSEFNLVDELKDNFITDIVYNQKNYKLAISKLKGYRGQENDLYSVVMVEK